MKPHDPRVFYVHHGVPTTYPEFTRIVLRRAPDFREFNGEVIALWMDHGPDFIINLFATWQAGAIPFLISRRLPVGIVSALLESAGAKLLLCPDSIGEELGPAVVRSSACASEGPSSEVDIGEVGERYELPIGAPAQAFALILHTSGTTNLPKLVRIGLDRLHASIDLISARWRGFWTEEDASLGFLPLFHVYGLYNELLCCYRAKSRYHFGTGSPHLIIEALEDASAGITLLFAVPWILQQILEIPGGLEALKRLRAIVVGGAVLGEDIGARLTSAGVRLVQGYGMTELGLGLMSAIDGDWRDLRPIWPESFMHLEGGDRGELVIHGDCPTLAVTPPRDYPTGDIFRRTPAGAYRYESRADELIVHSTGEKSNALFIEQALLARLRHLLDQALIVGGGRLHLACVVQWKRSPGDEDRRALSQAIEQLNAELPAYSKVHERMVLYLSPDDGRRLPLTGKGTVMRKRAEQELKDEIAALYNGAVDLPAGQTLASFFERPVDPSVSLFEQGVDSLTAALLRNHIARLRPDRDVPFNVVYQHPTLEAIEGYLRGLPTVEVLPPTFPPYGPDERLGASFDYPPPRRVLLTGATGFVGSELLEALLRSEHVEHVHCLVRKAPRAPARNEITYHEGYELADPRFGLSREVFEALRGEVDTLLHGAWPVDFNATYKQMSGPTLASVRHLIDFTRHGDKTFHFLSTVATVMRSQPGGKVEEDFPAPTSEGCMPHGYAQTKWEAEHLLVRSGIRHKIHRMGQISAHRETGRWNEREHIPVLLHAARVLSCVPILPQPIDWVPVDVACQVIVELLSAPRANVHHIAHPRPRPASCLAQGLPGLPLSEWMALAAPHLGELPRLQALFPFLYNLVSMGDRLASLGVEKTCGFSPTLAGCPDLDDAYLSRLVRGSD